MAKANVDNAAASSAGVINAYVNTDGLNLRASPNGAILAELTLADPVVDLGPVDGGSWRKVRVKDRAGVVFGKYLRPPEKPEIEALVAAAVAEWVRFDRGDGREDVLPYYKYVGEMWRKLGFNLDGRDTGTPWSAAFISFVVGQAGKDHPTYEAFKSAASHSVFAHDAIQARILGWKDRPFWGYRRTEEKPALGDIIHRNRAGNDFSFDHAENHAHFISHSDIVVQVTQHAVRVLGGNVGNTVSLSSAGSDDSQEYELDGNGFIAPGQKVIALLKNRAAEATAAVLIAAAARPGGGA